MTDPDFENLLDSEEEDFEDYYDFGKEEGLGWVEVGFGILEGCVLIWVCR